MLLFDFLHQSQSFYFAYLQLDSISESATFPYDVVVVIFRAFHDECSGLDPESYGESVSLTGENAKATINGPLSFRPNFSQIETLHDKE